MAHYTAAEHAVVTGGAHPDHPRMTDLGEKKFIEMLLPKLADDRRLLQGRGHDAAALTLDTPVSRLAFKVDRAARPVSISENWSDYKAWGRLAVTANCSDILATGGTPLAFMLAVLVPGDWPAERVEDMILGCQEECQRRDIAFAGGDTKESATPHLVGTAVGVYEPGARVLQRNTATAGQSLLMCGPVGGFLGAYLEMKRNPDHPTSAQWKEYLAWPEARWSEAGFCQQNLTLSAGVDASDGLYDAMVELTRSGIGLELDLDEIPYHPFATVAAEKFGIPLENFLFGAGDWNILYACAEQNPDLADRGKSDVVARVGRFIDTPGIFANRAGLRYRLTGPRNEHFRKRLEDGVSWIDNVTNNTWLHPLTSDRTYPGAVNGV